MRHFTELSTHQHKHMTDTAQLWDAYCAAKRRAAGYAGSIRWKVVNDAEYLVKTVAGPDKPKTASLGRRSPETEMLFETFATQGDAARDRVKSLSEALETQARVNKAFRLGRVPITPARVLRHIYNAGLLGGGCSVVGTNAIYAYEARAGVICDQNMMATIDLDLMMHAKARLRMVVERVDPVSLMSLLKRADRSFERDERALYRATNRDGYAIELIKLADKNALKPERDGFGVDDLNAAEIRNMRWVANAPSLESIAIDEAGFPVPIVAPDPRAFAAYKLWLSTSPDAMREPIKRTRDRQQAETIIQIVKEYMPDLPFTRESLSSFPASVADLVESFGYFAPAQRGGEPGWM